MDSCEAISADIQKLLDSVQLAIGDLQQGVRAVSADWSDAKGREFIDALQDLANETMGLFEGGDACRKELDEFQLIADERY